MLTDLQCRKAKPAEKPYKLSDSAGLYLYVTTTGFKSWRLKYRFPAGATERKLILGPYPEVSLVEAREARELARKQLRDGVDPGVQRKQRAAEASIGSASTFEAVAREWHRVKLRTWTKRYGQQILDRLSADIFPKFGNVAIKQVTPAMVLDAIRLIERRGAREMAHVVRQHVSAVFVYAIGVGLVPDDPAHVIRSALEPVIKGRHPAVLKITEARSIIRTVDQRAGAYVGTKLASRLLALTAVRPGVLTHAEQVEFENLDGEEPIWRIPAAKMKLSRERKGDRAFEFIVPLSRQAVETVKAAMDLAGQRKWLFPAAQSPRLPMGKDIIRMVYIRCKFGGLHVPHGWRATFSTIMNERAAKQRRASDRAVIDLMLAHVPDGVEAAYNRAAYMSRRRELSQAWADLLMGDLPPPATLLPPVA